MDKIRHKLYHKLNKDLLCDTLDKSKDKLFRQLQKEHSKKIKEENRKLKNSFEFGIRVLLSELNLFLFGFFSIIYYMSDFNNPLVFAILVLLLLNVYTLFIDGVNIHIRGKNG